MVKNKKVLLLLIIILIVIIAGIIVAALKGFNYDSYYSENIKVEYKDIISQYLRPLVSSLLIILVYLGIRFSKQNPIKVVALTIAILSIVELLAISIIVLARIPLSIYIMPLLLGIYIITLIGTTYYFEKNK